MFSIFLNFQNIYSKKFSNLHMKISRLILILSLLSFIQAQDTIDRCYTQFKSTLQTQCQHLGSCSLNSEDHNKCIPTSSCSGKTSSNCATTIPSNFHLKKCVLDNDGTTCIETDKVCSDYDKSIDGTSIGGDTCSSLTKEPNKGDRCYLSYPNNNLNSERGCISHYNSCDSINSLDDKSKTICEANIPSELKNKCEWNTDTLKCTEVPRNCDDYKYLNKDWPSKTNCNSLKASEGAACVFYGGICMEAYPCSKWNEDTDGCNNYQTPLNDAKTDFDYLYKCEYQDECKKVRKICDEYNDSNLKKESGSCPQFIAKDQTNKKCVLSSSYRCIEQYKTCQIYNDKEEDKSRAECEALILDDDNKKCVYIKEEHKCEEGNIYNNCNEYKGSDKKICERILSPKTKSYCVLDKDSVCKERDFYCAEAYDRYDCLIYAKPTDNTKKCVWTGSDCKEQYKGCEDFEIKRSDSENDCDSLEVYNGKTCYYDSDKCKSKDKVCSQATSKEECKLIEKNGVSDPDRKYCKWYLSTSSSSCRENYKYCSDYRGTSSTTCQDILPYDKETNTLDLAYKCDIKDSSVGCEKVPKECSAGNGNKILCDKISSVLKDNKFKYCAFIAGSCIEHYKTCELVDEDKLTSSTVKCTSNIPQNEYVSGTCETYTDNEKTKCRTKTTSKCNLFTPSSYQDLCLSINANCSYDYGYCFTQSNSCSNIKFYSENENNKDICEAFIPTDEDKICVLKEDKSGCEEVYRESFTFIYADNINKNSDSRFNLSNNGMNVILILLSLLF